VTLRRNLDSFGIQEEWLELPDLYQFLQSYVFRSSVETIMGSKILNLNPSMTEDFWTFNYKIPAFLRCLPRWIIPKAYASRDRLLSGIKKWHAYANKHYDVSKMGPDDPEWEPFFRSKLVKARQQYALRMPQMNADARASEDLGLLFM
ncbi:hypothetical protein F4779DRAFT_640505, partial [Xylariaceae sp. FL0662B]